MRAIACVLLLPACLPALPARECFEDRQCGALARCVDRRCVASDPRDASSSGGARDAGPDDRGKDAGDDSASDALAKDGEDAAVVSDAEARPDGGGGTDAESDAGVARDSGGLCTLPAWSLDIIAGSQEGDGPKVASMGPGEYLAIWHGPGGAPSAGLDIYVSHGDSFGWSMPARINSTNPGAEVRHDCYPKLVRGAGANVVATWWSSGGWCDGAERRVRTIRSNDNGETWGAETQFSEIDSWLPQIATDRLGFWMIVWESTDSLGDPSVGADPDILLARGVGDAAETWGQTGVLPDGVGDTKPDVEPHVATNGAGRWLIAWRDGEFGLRGVWSDGQMLLGPSFALTEPGWDSRPRIVTDGAGTWIVAFATAGEPSAGLGPDQEVAFRRSTDDGATWSPVAAFQHSAASDGRTDARVELATDGRNWVAVWQTEVAAGLRKTYVSMSCDGGASWTAAEVLATDAQQPHVAADGVGGWTVVWTGGVAASQQKIYSARAFIP